MNSSCILNGMQETATVRVSRETRDRLREMAVSDGVTLDEEIRRLLRKERQRRIGDALAARAPDPDDESWLRLGVETVAAE